MTKRITATLSFAGLTKGLEPKVYAVGKVHAWMNLLNQNMRPTKFFEPTKSGTKVNIEQILGQEDYDKGLKELEKFANLVNRKHGTDFKFKPESEV